jgi:hypothetical protein
VSEDRLDISWRRVAAVLFERDDMTISPIGCKGTPRPPSRAVSDRTAFRDPFGNRDRDRVRQEWLRSGNREAGRGRTSPSSSSSSTLFTQGGARSGSAGSLVGMFHVQSPFPTSPAWAPTARWRAGAGSHGLARLVARRVRVCRPVRRSVAPTSQRTRRGRESRTHARGARVCRPVRRGVAPTSDRASRGREPRAHTHRARVCRPTRRGVAPTTDRTR